MNEVEDHVYDWMLLNNGKGWELDMDVSLAYTSCMLDVGGLSGTPPIVILTLLSPLHFTIISKEC